MVKVSLNLKNLKCLDTHIRCGCHVLNTVAKRITEPYKFSGLSTIIKNNSAVVKIALDTLQKLVVGLRRFTSVRESLGTALHVPGETRWTSKLDMVERFLQSKPSILKAVEENKPQSLSEVKKVYAEYESIYEDYCKVVGPIKKRIADLEVRSF